MPGRSNVCFPVFDSNPSLPGGVFSLQITDPAQGSNGPPYPTEPPGYGSGPYQSEAAVETARSTVCNNCELGASLVAVMFLTLLRPLFISNVNPL